jgi:ribosomal protein S12 methylthiotransferase accessory factor YcaO-like protein
MPRSPEREASSVEAVKQLERWLRHADFEREVEYLWGESKSPQADYPSIVRAHLYRNEVLVGEGTGKGFGSQAVASGLYEALEDLALSLSHRPSSSPMVEEIVRAGAILTDPPKLVRPYDLSQDLATLDALHRMLRESTDSEYLPAVPMRQPQSKSLSPAGYLGESSVPIPCALSDIKYVPPPGSRAERIAYRYCSSNGVASGLSAVEALLHAINEVNERDTLGVFLLDVMRRRPHGDLIDVSGMEWALELTRSVEQDFGVDVELRRLESLWGNVVVSLSSRADSRGCRIVGAGASWSLPYAVERATLELAQNLVAESCDTDDVDGILGSLDRLKPYPNLLAAARLDSIPDPTTFIRLEHTVTQIPERQLRLAIGTLSEKGFGSYARRLFASSHVDSSLFPQVWQVVVPGLERFHLVRAGLPVELTGRLRKPETIALSRESNILRGDLSGSQP